ncbi:putative armadillo-like helical, importin beta family [Helianthus anomalus]
MTYSNPVSLKEATLEALGYVCQGISHDDLAQDEVEKVLNVVVNGMDVAENSPPVRLVATRALKNALALDQARYRTQENVSVVLGATAETEWADIRKVAFECLGSVVSTYYAVLEPYRDILVERTINALKGDETDLAL